MAAVESDRKLATIVTVSNITPIKDADNIEVANFKENTWDVVVKKNEFKVGDLVIYFSIDSILDETEYTKFLDGKRLKTRKIRGVISQGLAGPLSWIKPYGVDISTLKADDDVTSIMKVRKYVSITESDIYDLLDSKTKEPRVKTAEEKELEFPSSIVPKTDEHRVQSSLGEVKSVIDNNYDVVISKKYDGTSCTIIYATVVGQNSFADGETKEEKKHEIFKVCSRNFVLVQGQPNTQDYFGIVDSYDLKNKMINLGKNLAIQGEICGPKINCNRMKRTTNDFFVFNIFDIDGHRYLSHEEVKKICAILGLKTVEIIHVGKLTDFLKLPVPETKTDSTPEQKTESDKSYIKMVAGKLVDFASTLEYSKGVFAEGMVIKTNFSGEAGKGRISFKVISNKYLLKHDE